MDVTLSTDDASLSQAVALMLKSEQATIQIKPGLPPVMIERGGVLNLEVGEINVFIDTPGGDFGDHLEATISGSIPVEIIGEDGELQIDLGEPNLAFMVRDSDWGAASNESITNMLSVMLSPTLIMAAVGEISFPLPSLTDSLEIKSVKVDVGEEQFNTGIRINLK
jgi:hypothetical protein